MLPLKGEPSLYQNWAVWANGLRTGALLGFISDIHRVLWVSAHPVDVRNERHQGIRPQAFKFFKFSDVNLESNFDPF